MERAGQDFRPSLREALRQLGRAREYAVLAQRDPWQFAVEWSALQALGVDLTDARWLMACGLVELRRETSLAGSFRRTFEELEPPRLTAESAFILTERGEAWFNQRESDAVRIVTASLPDHAQSASAAPVGDGPRDRPHWDADQRELRFRGEVVKRFRVPAKPGTDSGGLRGRGLAAAH